MRNFLPVAVIAMVIFGLARAPVAAPKKTAGAVSKSAPLSESVRRGLEWLVRRQQPTGGWSQGEESAAMSGGPTRAADSPNVADTAMAALALIRSGSTMTDGRYADNIRRAVRFVCEEVIESPAQGIAVTGVQGTRLQAKLGRYIDTFAAAQLLAEVKDQTTSEAEKSCVLSALEKTMHKLENNQLPDGTWAKDGWAPVLAQGMVAKAINRAAQRGYRIDEEMREQVEVYALGQFDGDSTFGGEGTAGVELYGAGANLNVMAESEKTNRELERKLRADLRDGALSDEERVAASDKLAKIERNREALQQAQKAVVQKMQDKQFVAGFGSNGGEEFLSYLNIGESLFANGCNEWQEWFASMTENLGRIQNADGSWTGHHCITGRTFCTAMALMVLTIDRGVEPIGGKIHG